jgi:acyl-CoA synthetase (AMP-forming)/AMP-acid ligase II
MSIFACDFGQVYGLTETAGAITYLPPEDHTAQSNVQRLLSCGKPLAGVDIKVVDAQGNEVTVGKVGHIICRTSKHMKGYWNLPVATSETIRGGWLYTGDAGYFDSEGYLYVHDRIDDMIITGGENVYPAEVENILFSHPAVADAAVIGVPDDRWGETVKAIVVRKRDAEITAEQLIAFTKERIASYKVPTSVDFVDALQRNASGKIVRREMRLQFGGGLTRNQLNGVLPSS